MLKQAPVLTPPSPGAPRRAIPRARPQGGRSLRRTPTVRRRGRTTENAARDLFQQPQIEKAFAPPLRSGTKASCASWYHPGSATNDTGSSITLHWPLTRAMRNPLLDVHGFGSEASSAIHRPACTTRRLSRICADRVLLLVVALRFGFYHRLIGLGKRFLPNRFCHQPEHSLSRSHQRVTGKHHK